ncbi:MAG: HD domain-containing protein [Lachnospiraceae bacterium]|nr:HD domain-containing protein [Lachnospiraceae bacterium]
MNSNKELIQKSEAFLKDKFNNQQYFIDHPSDGEYRLQHSYRVANIGKMIAEKEGFNVTEMVIACLFHDIGYSEDFKSDDDWINHGRKSAKIARPFLLSLGLPNDRVEDICYGIAIHVDDKADFEGKRTPFAETISDADNIDRFDAYRIYETLQYNKFSQMTFDEKQDNVNSMLDKLNKYSQMQLATKTASKIWKQRIDFYILFYQKLRQQLENSTSIVSLPGTDIEF